MKTINFLHMICVLGALYFAEEHFYACQMRKLKRRNSTERKNNLQINQILNIFH